MVVILVYRPPNGDYNNFIIILSEILETICRNKLVLLAGDFNVNFFDKSPMKVNLINLLTSFNLCQTINEATRVTAFSSTCIDNIFINLDSELFSTKVLKTSLSDHYGQFIKININSNIITDNDKILRRNFSKENIKGFSQHLQEETWISVLSENEAEEAFNRFSDTLHYYFDISFPFKNQTHRNQKNTPTFYTNEIMNLKNKVSLYADLSRQYPEFKEAFTYVNKQYQQVLRKTKQDFYDNQVLASENKNKTMWTIINSNTNRTKKQQDIKIKECDIVLNDKQAADKFNEHFINIPATVTASLDSNIDFDFIDANVPLADKTLFFTPVTQKDVHEIILKLKHSNSYGEDEISNCILKEIGIYVLEPLTHVINLSLEQGTFPSKLKNAIIKPLYKKGNCDSVENYRPISMLPSVSKVYESSVSGKLASYFLDNKMLDEHQHGFTKNKSLDSAMCDLIGEITSCLDNKLTTMGLFIDFSKAFDCVNHIILLSKLERYGVRGVCLKWIESYLTDRHQMVQISQSKSQSLTIATGVPQGSILGPILFIIFINDLAKYLKKFNSLQVSYADDTNFIVKGTSIETVEYLIKNIFSELCLWVDKNKLCINTEKTCCLLFKLSTTSFSNGTIILNKTSIEYTQSTKFLGVIVDCHLNWKEHIDYLCERLSKICYALRSVSNHCSQSIVRQLYFGCFHSILKFGITHWGQSVHAHRVFVIQKWAIRILAGLRRRDTCKNAFKQLNILTFPSVYIYEILCFTYRNKNKYNTVGSSHDYPTRYKTLLQPDKPNTRMYQRSLHYNSCQFYNVLPEEVKCLTNFYQFKHAVKKLLLDKTCYSVQDFLIYH